MEKDNKPKAPDNLPTNLPNNLNNLRQKQFTPTPKPAVEKFEIKEEKATPRIIFRVLILAAILVVLVVLSIGIIRLVPVALRSLANVNISISSLFNPRSATSTNNYNATSTKNASSTPTYNPAPGSGATTTAPYPSNNGGNSGNTSGSYGTPSGTPDLEVRITAIGTLDRTTGAFVANTNANSNDRIAVRFQIENVGKGPSGSWNLTANLPAVNPADQTKYLPNQTSIPAGLAVSGEVYFDYIQTGQNRLVKISVTDSKAELQSGNNSAQITINASGNGSGGIYPGGGTVVTNGVDLVVRILDTGVLDRNSGQYNTTSYVRASDRAGIRFQVTNQGSIPSGTWAFSANLPGNNNYNNNNNGCYYNNGYYACPNNTNNSNNSINQSNQTSLSAGENRIYIIGFDGLQYGSNNNVSINVDPYNQTSDVNRGNNYASTNIYVNNY